MLIPGFIKSHSLFSLQCSPGCCTRVFIVHWRFRLQAEQVALPLLASLYAVCVARLDTLWNKWCKIWSKKEPSIVAAWLVLSERRLSTWETASPISPMHCSTACCQAVWKGRWLKNEHKLLLLPNNHMRFWQGSQRCILCTLVASPQLLGVSGLRHLHIHRHKVSQGRGKHAMTYSNFLVLPFPGSQHWIQLNYLAMHWNKGLEEKGD